MANPTVPPQLTGPRMAVWGYFPFDGRVIDADGTHADWDWAMKQWDRVAGAGAVVRLVVADQLYSRIDLTTAAGPGQRSAVRAKFDACRAAGQLVFGRVYVAGGKLRVGPEAALLEDPLRPGRKVPAVADQINAWQTLFEEHIDGIYLDSGPVDCTDPQRPGSVIGIPDNYAGYAHAVRQQSYKLFIQVAQFPDNEPGRPWVQRLGADFLEIWEAGVLLYRTRFEARDACRPDVSPGVPDWWKPAKGLRWSRVHVINDCRDADAMRSIAKLAVGDQRVAGTVWITRSRQDPNFGAVFDVLPPYWDEEVLFFRDFLIQDEKGAKDAKDDKDDKDNPDAAEQKIQKDDKDSKDNKDGKDGKDDKENKDGKDKEDKDAKDDKEQKDEKDEKDGKEEKDSKDNKDDPDTITPKQEKDLKDLKDVPDKKSGVFEKDSESRLKGLEVTGLGDVPGFLEDEPAPALADDEPVPLGRTFIRPEERPEVGSSIVADPDEAGASQP
ncbi:hypothetical protein ACFS5L_15940 [Streptomyces phyllanthi]|uniref:hypothetical protein n=1 Tax=Streptomyces phyllanthi TaxID=1803180 RepID=UPI0018843F71|nr:hypothetical protein [Streptomyces phyllanthi]